MEKMNNTDDLFTYDLKTVDKIDSMSFNVNCESDLFVDLDNEWHVSRKSVKFFSDFFSQN